MTDVLTVLRRARTAGQGSPMRFSVEDVLAIADEVAAQTFRADAAASESVVMVAERDAWVAVAPEVFQTPEVFRFFVDSLVDAASTLATDNARLRETWDDDEGIARGMTAYRMASRSPGSTPRDHADAFRDAATRGGLR